MRINAEIKIKVYWDDVEKVNKTTFEIDINKTPSVILTALEMTKNSVSEVLENYIKQKFENGKCTEEEFKKLMNINFSILTTF